MRKRRYSRVRGLLLSTVLTVCVTAGCIFSTGAEPLHESSAESGAGGIGASRADSSGNDGLSMAGGTGHSMPSGDNRSEAGGDSTASTSGNNASLAGEDTPSAPGGNTSSSTGAASSSSNSGDVSSLTGDSSSFPAGGDGSPEEDSSPASGDDSPEGGSSPSGGDDRSVDGSSPTGGDDRSEDAPGEADHSEADTEDAGKAPVITAVMTGTHPYLGRYYTNARSASLTITFSGTGLRPELCTATVGELETKCAEDFGEREKPGREDPPVAFLRLARVGSGVDSSPDTSADPEQSHLESLSSDTSTNADQRASSNPSQSHPESLSSNTSADADQSTSSDPSSGNPSDPNPGTPGKYEDPQSYSISFSEEELRSLNDGEVRITVSAEDSAGRVTRSFSDDSEGLELSGGTDRAGSHPAQDPDSEVSDISGGTDKACAFFVLDRTAPVCAVNVISPESANQELQGAGNRYYFNRAFFVRVTVTDDTAIARETLSIGRASQRNVTGSNADVAFGSDDYLAEDLSGLKTGDGQLWSDFEAQWEALNKAHSGSRPDGFPGTVSASWTETVSPDPAGSNEIFQYLVTGRDCAGNEISPLYSAPIVLDTEAPRGTVSISGNGSTFYAASTDGGASVLEPYRKETAASVRLAADSSEHSPVHMTWRVEASPRANSLSGQSEGYAFGQTAEFRQTGRQQFRLTSFVISDLAGNQTVFRSAPEIFLDADPPDTDVLGPAVSVRAEVDGAGSDGRYALYNESVPVRVQVKDPYEGEGGSGLGDVTMTVSMDGQVLEKETKALRRAGDADRFGGRSFELTRTETIDAKQHEGGTVCVRVKARDHAGNESEAFVNFRIDATPPSVSVRYLDDTARNGKYFREARKAEITVSDRSFDPSGIRIDTGAGAVRGVWKRVIPTNTWVSALTFREDGRYSLAVSGRDLAGNESPKTDYIGAAPREFIIDTKAPRITLAYDRTEHAGGRYFHSSRIGFISVEDENFGGENALTVSGGDNSGQAGISFSDGKCTVVFRKDGAYRLSGTVTDLAGNVSKPLAGEEFVIDTKKPELTISGVKDRSSNREPVSIEISAADPNMSGSSLSYTLSRQRPGEESRVIREGISTGFVRMSSLDKDGLYVLKAQAEDLAGNRTEKSISFTENQAGTSFTFVQEEMRNACTNRLFKPAFILQNIDAVKVLSVTVNGRETSYKFQKNRLTVTGGIRKDGRYVINIDTRDAAGNRDSMSPVAFTLDRTPPTLTVRGLKHGAQIYYEPFAVTLVRESPDDEFSELVVDGRQVKNPEMNGDGSVTFRIDTPGAHTIRAGLTDKAGNTGPVRTLRVVLTDNAALRWIMNRAGFCASIAAAAALLVWLLLRRKTR